MKTYSVNIAAAILVIGVLFLNGCVDPQQVGKQEDATETVAENSSAATEEPTEDSASDTDATEAPEMSDSSQGTDENTASNDAEPTAPSEKPALPVPAANSPETPTKNTAKKWNVLFDGKSLKGWKTTEFGGEGEAYVEDGGLVLEPGNPMTGVHTDRKLPKINYEVEAEAQRNDGSDFFFCLTFMVGDKPCSLVLGGWGGGVTGLSSIDDMDASENETTSFEDFKAGQWYKIRLRVTDKKIEAWLDKKQIVDLETANRELSIRFEVEPSLPFGVASFQTRSIIRKLQIRELSADELK